METPKNLPDGKNNQLGSQKHALKNHLSKRKHVELPVDAFKESILQAVEQKDEVIISAETGAGKSTRVPQFLYEAGYNVIVTQPRRLAAMSLAKHVAHEVGSPLGEIVGYHIGGVNEENKKISNQTRIKYCTDGLQLVQQLMKAPQQTSRKTVLVIDEVHEWNQNIEILLAWVKKEKLKGNKIKIVLMSATLDEEALTKFFTFSHGENLSTPASLEVPGRLYPVECEVASSKSLIAKAQELVKAQRNILIFQPGKKEIMETIQVLENVVKNEAIILPLHGELSVEEQEKVFKQYEKPVIIVSTNVAQTSVTIPYIDAVIDSGKEKRIELIDGVETLVLGDISKADVKQRAGRAGRCKPGIYIYCNDTPQSDLANFPIAEIERTRLDLNYLRILARTGYPMEELEFVHQPSQENIMHAKETLLALGAIDEQGKVTALGEQLVALPVDVHEGCMILKACEYGVLDDILKIAAIKQADGIISHQGMNDVPSSCIDRDSDLLTQLNLFALARDVKSKKGPQGETISKEQQLIEYGIHTKAYFRAVEIYHNLKELFGREVVKYTNKNLDAQQKKYYILKAITAGMLDNIWISRSGYRQKSGGDTRMLSKRSFVSENTIIVGEPVNIQFLDRRGRQMQLDLITQASTIPPEYVEELAPHKISKVKHYDKRNSKVQKVVHQLDTLFNGLVIKEEEKQSELSSESVMVFCEALSYENVRFDNPLLKEVYEHNKEILKQMEQLKIRTLGSIPGFSRFDLAQYFYEILHNKGIITTQDFADYLARDPENLLEALKLNPVHLLVRDYDKILAQYPEQVVYQDKSYTVKYGGGWYGNSIQICINPEDLEILSQESFSSYFEGKTYEFLLEDSSGSKKEIKNIDEYKQKLLQEYINEKWKNFDATFNAVDQSSQSFSNRDGQEEIQERCFDEKTGSMAYLGLVKCYNEYAFTRKRFRNKESALQSTQEVQKSYQIYLEEMKTKELFLQTHQEYSQIYFSLKEKLDTLSDRSSRAGARNIIDTMNTIEYHLRNKEDCYQGDLDTIKEGLSQIEQLLQDFDIYKKTLESAKKQFAKIKQKLFGELKEKYPSVYHEEKQQRESDYMFCKKFFEGKETYFYDEYNDTSISIVYNSDFIEKYILPAQKRLSSTIQSLLEAGKKKESIMNDPESLKKLLAQKFDKVTIKKK